MIHRIMQGNSQFIKKHGKNMLFSLQKNSLEGCDINLGKKFNSEEKTNTVYFAVVTFIIEEIISLTKYCSRLYLKKTNRHT